MEPTVLTDLLLHLSLGVALTVWVARTLTRNGVRFLVDVCEGDRELAAPVNHILAVGFHLVNVGCVLLALRTGAWIGGLGAGIEGVGWKVGLVLVVLGAMHLLSPFVLGRLRGGRRASSSA